MDLVCDACKMRVTPQDEGCRAMNKVFHVRCFVCSDCKQPLTSTFSTLNGKYYCQTHYIARSAPRCKACSKPVSGQVVKAGDGQYHLACFVCSSCGKGLGGQPFMPHEGKMLCVSCFHTNHGPQCSRCKQPILPEDGKALQVDNRTFHERCLTCADCNVRLNGGVFPVNGEIYCQSHAKKRLAPAPSRDTSRPYAASPSVQGRLGPGATPPMRAADKKSPHVRQMAARAAGAPRAPPPRGAAPPASNDDDDDLPFYSSVAQLKLVQEGQNPVSGRPPVAAPESAYAYATVPDHTGGGGGGDEFTYATVMPTARGQSSYYATPQDAKRS